MKLPILSTQEFNFHTIVYSPVILFYTIINFPIRKIGVVLSTPTVYLLNSIISTILFFMSSYTSLEVYKETLQFLYTHKGLGAVEPSSRIPWNAGLEVADTQIFSRSILTENPEAHQQFSQSVVR